MKRQPGFYWVKYNGEWYVMQWKEDGFYSGFWGPGAYEGIIDSDCDDIDERRLIRE